MLGEILPRSVLPSEIELLIKEVRALKAELTKIKAVLKKHGIDVD